MKELVVISGKGGTGKTSVVASFAALGRGAVLADCDVDAADLHLVMDPSAPRCEAFAGGLRAAIDPELCLACGQCAELCRFDAIRDGAAGQAPAVDPMACEGCGVCADFCPAEAIELAPATGSAWCVSETRYGPMVHARVGVGQGNSGKLVTVVRTQAERVAERNDLDLVIIDGAPGIGCPVIASLAGADLAVVVTEPSLAGLQDLDRVSALTSHFRIPTLLCINRWDVNPQLAFELVDRAADRGVETTEMIRYDRAVCAAQAQARPVVALGERGAAGDIRRVWDTVRWNLDGLPQRNHQAGDEPHEDRTR
jgi:MinD superfamily P-loop ATPase